MESISAAWRMQREDENLRYDRGLELFCMDASHVATFGYHVPTPLVTSASSDLKSFDSKCGLASALSLFWFGIGFEV